MEHIEQRACTPGIPRARCPRFPCQRLQDEVMRQTVAMARALHVVGLINVQFAIRTKSYTCGR